MARGSGIGASMLLSYYADLAEKTVFKDVRPSQGFVSKYAVVVQEPVGVVAAVNLWNRSLKGMFMKVAPALAAGCTLSESMPSYSTSTIAALTTSSFVISSLSGLPRFVVGFIEAP